MSAPGVSSSFSIASKNSNSNSNSSNKADKDCTAWRSKGKCNKYKKDKCPYRHDEGVRLAAIERNRQKMIFDTQINNTNGGKKKQQQLNRKKKQKQQNGHPLGIVFAEGQREPKSYSTNGRRHIAPYYIVVSLPLQKYAGKTIQEAIDGVSTRTKRPSKEYWEHSLRAGKLTLYESNNNNNSNKGDGGSSEAGGYKCIAKPTHIIEKQNVLKGKYHYHEESIPSSIVSQQQLSIVYQDDEYLVCNKPCSIDVCTNINAGRIYNSLPGLLHTEFGIANALYPAHRIDNNVSGIVCFGKTITAQKRLSRRIKFHEAQKTYYARVQLLNNDEAATTTSLEQLDQQIQQLQQQLPIIIDVPLGFDTDTCLAFTTTTTTNGDDDTKATREKVKECKTTIISITAHPSLDGTAIVQVQPNTGRPHQLRKHLQHVNLCIANDERYGGSMKKMTSGSDDTDATTTSIEMEEGNVKCNNKDEEALVLATSYQPTNKNDESTSKSAALASLPSGDVQSSTFDKDCSSCMNPSSHSNVSSGSGIWLHSFRYEFPSLNLMFETPIPDWVI